jgi:transposase
MAKRYRPVVRDQLFLLPPDMREWLPAGHPVHVVIEVVSGHLGTSVLHASRKTGGVGRAGYDPDMLVTLLIWAYANKVTSSRRIEALCWTDVAFRLVCAGDVPDHVTIARFRAQIGPAAAGELFAQVLACCARLGMGQVGVIAVDGTKVMASAGKSANRTEETLRKLAADLATQHAADDAAEDDLFGPGRRGDEVPPDVAGPRTRGERIAAALAGLAAEREAEEAAAEVARQAAEEQGQAYLQAAAAGRPGPGVPPGVVAVAAAQARLDRARAARRAQLAELDRRASGPLVPGHRRDKPRAGVEDYCLVTAARQALDKARDRAAARATRDAAAAAAARAPVRNITDPDSRLMPTRAGFIQGYNAQNVASSDGLIIATRLTTDTTDTAWYQPMITAAGRAADLITCHRPPGSTAGGPIGLVLADAGYLSAENLAAPGPDRLIATAKHRDLEKTARAGPTPAHPPTGSQASPLITAMTARLATPGALKAYRQRGHIAETPHGNIKHNLGFRQFSMRGKDKTAAEWALACTVHNLIKAITTGHLTTTALTI